MNIPQEINMQTKEFVQVFTKFCLYLTKYGARAMEDYLDSVPLKMAKANGKHLGAYLINKICQEFESDNTPVTKFDLFESKSRRPEIAEARMLLCVFTEKYLHLSNAEISLMFNRSRHFAKHAIRKFGELDEHIPDHRKLLTKFKKLDALVSAYVNFKPKSKAS